MEVKAVLKMGQSTARAKTNKQKQLKGLEIQQTQPNLQSYGNALRLFINKKEPSIDYFRVPTKGKSSRVEYLSSESD